MKKTLEITLEQARELLKTTPSLTDVIHENFPQLKMSNSWENLGYIKGCYINGNSEMEEVPLVKTYEQNRFIYANHKQAKAALAYAQLTQLMKATGDCDVDWSDNSKVKYVIKYGIARLFVNTVYSSVSHLAFNTKEIAVEFMQKHERLIKDFYMQD